MRPGLFLYIEGGTEMEKTEEGKRDFPEAFFSRGGEEMTPGLRVPVMSPE